MLLTEAYRSLPQFASKFVVDAVQRFVVQAVSGVPAGKRPGSRTQSSFKLQGGELQTASDRSVLYASEYLSEGIRTVILEMSLPYPNGSVKIGRAHV